MAKAYCARVSVLLAATALTVNAFTGCVDDRNVGLAPDSSAGASGKGGDAPASGGSAGRGGAAGSGGAAGNDASSGGTSGAAGNDSGIQDSSSEAGVALDQFCSALLSEVCKWEKTCQSRTRCEDWPQYPRIQATCLAAPAAVAAGRLRYDPLEGRKCLDAVSGSTGSAEAGTCQRGGGPTVATSFQRGEGACARVFVGQVPAGGDCYPESSIAQTECLDGVCSRTGSACPGKCLAYRKLNESCGAANQFCNPDTFCNVNFCAARRGVNENCDDEKQCQKGLLCVPKPAAGTLKHCVPSGTEGDPCDTYESCPGRECYQGKCRLEVPTGAACRSDLACPDSQVCVFDSTLDKVGVCGPPVAPGTLCGKDTDCAGYDPRTGGVTCKSSNGTAPPVCTSPAPLLAPCGSRACSPACGVILCEANAYCDIFGAGSPVCRSPGQSGASCTEQQQCATGLICASRTSCRAPAPQGQPCSPEDFSPPSCQEGLYCDWHTRVCIPPRSGVLAQCTPRWSNSCVTGEYCACPDETCATINLSSPITQTSCQPKRANGADCKAAFQCLGGYCNSGKCASFPHFTFCDGIDDVTPEAG